jgi:transglutaminase-like putative cysteine protease
VKLDSLKVVYWYSLVSAVAAGAVLFAYLGALEALLGSVLVMAITHFILVLVAKTDEQSSPYLKISEQIAAAGIIVFLPLLILYGPLLALLVFIGFAHLALLLQTHDYRRLYMGLAVGFTALIAGAVESKSGLYLIFFLAYAVTISMTLGYAYIEPLSRNRSQWNPLDQLRATAWLLGIALTIYLIVPRLPAGSLGAIPGSDHFYENPEWEQEAERQHGNKADQDPAGSLQQELADRLNDEGSDPEPRQTSGKDSSESPFHYRGFDYEMEIDNPDDQGDRFSNAIVAHVRADHPLYLRARIFDRFDDLRWYSSAHQTSKLQLSRGEIELHQSTSLSADSLTEHYEVFVERDLGDYIPAAAVPIKVNFPSRVIAVDAFGQLHSPGALKSGTAYAVTSLRTRHRGRTFAETDHLDLPNFKQLPKDMDPRIIQLTRQITDPHDSQFAKAIAIEQFLRNNYTYDFESIFNSQHRTPLSRFLFETKRGHCEYFASALAIMLRTQGIPSRLVTGFSATNQNPMTGYYDVYALDGHAWVEAYVDELGWLELEPTAYYDGPSAENETLSAEQINDYVERQLRLQQAMGVTDLTFETLMSALWQTGYLIFTWSGAYLKLLFLNTWPWLIAVASMLLCLWIAWPHIKPRWHALRIKRRLLAAPTASVHQAIANHLQAIDELLRNAGYQRPAGLTIEQMLDRLRSLEIPLQADRISLEFNRLHYSDSEVKVDLSHYGRIFDMLYSMGHGRLRQRIRAMEQWPNSVRDAS